MEKKKEAAGPEETLLKAKSDALRLLSFRPRSVSEMRQRLKMKRFPADVIERTVELLSAQGLLNDEQFAKLFAHSRVFSRPSGKRQLEFELKKKGVSPETAARAIAGLGEYDERQAAKDLVALRVSKMTGISVDKKKARVFGLLKRRGFSNQTIYSVFDELFKDTGNLE